jgi:hypothetical protein
MQKEGIEDMLQPFTAKVIDELNALHKAFLKGEGIEVEDNRIDLETYQFHPERI